MRSEAFLAWHSMAKPAAKPITPAAARVQYVSLRYLAIAVAIVGAMRAMVITRCLGLCFFAKRPDDDKNNTYVEQASKATALPPFCRR